MNLTHSMVILSDSLGVSWAFGDKSHKVEKGARSLRIVVMKPWVKMKQSS